MQKKGYRIPQFLKDVQTDEIEYLDSMRNSHNKVEEIQKSSTQYDKKLYR